MTLSEAIRLGAMLTPQAFGDYWDGTGTCAIGAAAQANGTAWDKIAAFELRFRTIFEHPCPACGDAPNDRQGGFINTVTHLNDYHRWTREAIADWVEQIEAQQDAAAPVTVFASA